MRCGHNNTEMKLYSISYRNKEIKDKETRSLLGVDSPKKKDI